MAHGEFWVWNSGESPVWGASAPLFPLLLALPLKLGADPTLTIIWCSVIFSVASLTACSVLLGARFGFIAGLSFTVLAALDTPLMFFAGSGLETPMTFAIVVFALYAVLIKRTDAVVGIAAGFLAIHKLDLVPFAGALVVGYAVMEKRLPAKTIAVATAIAVAWYAFAWAWFGAPVPNSFLTKALHQNDAKTITWSWFGSSLLWRNFHWLFLVLGAFGIVRAWKENRAVAIFATGAMAAHLVAYSIKYPVEPYDWYYMPALLLLTMLASVGLSSIERVIGARFPKAPAFGIVSGLVILCAITASLWSFERNVTDFLREWQNTVEVDRSDAGRWVNDHTPKSYTVATWWGNPALYSNRYVYDGSFLNRRYEPGNLIEQYRPEIIILQNSPDSTPMHPPRINDAYVPVKVFDSAFAAGRNIFFTVYARKDAIPAMTGVSFPVKTSCESDDACKRYLPMKADKPTTIANNSAPSMPSDLCSIDLINNVPRVQNNVINTSNEPVLFEGWSLLNSENHLPDEVLLKFAAENGTMFEVRARTSFPRPDVVAALHRDSGLTDSGYKAIVDMTGMASGHYLLSVVSVRGGKQEVCGHLPVVLSSR